MENIEAEYSFEVAFEAQAQALVQEQVYIEVDQVQELELDKVAEQEQDMVEEQVQVFAIKKNKDNKSFMIMFCSSWFSSSCNDMNNQLFITYLTTSWNRNWYRTWLRDRNGVWLRYWLWNRNTTGKKERYEIICNNRSTYIG